MKKVLTLILLSIAGLALCQCRSVTNTTEAIPAEVVETKVIWDAKTRRLEHRSFYRDSQGKEVLHGICSVWENGQPVGRWSRYEHGKLVANGDVAMNP